MVRKVCRRPHLSLIVPHTRTYRRDDSLPDRSDTHEGRSGVIEALRVLGIQVEVRSLNCGDYSLPNGMLVERKAVPDLHDAIVRGRFWPQVGRLRRTSRWPYLLIEGDRLKGPLASDAVRGACLAVVGQGIPLIQTRSPIDTARWLRLLAMRCGGLRLCRDRPAYAQRLKPQGTLVREAMLACVPGISVASARALLERFGSITGVVEADPHDLRAVAGIGPARAESLRRAFS
jgi:ERCC4-type nuclease